MKNQEIIDMDNFMLTATPKEAIAYLREVANKAFAKITGALDRAIETTRKVADKCRSLFTKRTPVKKGIRPNMDLRANVFMIDWNSPQSIELMEALDDEIEMERLYSEALDIITQTKDKK